MSIPHQILKNRQRSEREAWPEFLSLRVHRALSWLDRAERCEDDDGCFVFLWVVNAAYADEAGEHRLPEAARLKAFLARLVELDEAGRLESIVWDKFPG